MVAAAAELFAGVDTATVPDSSRESYSSDETAAG